MTKSGKQARGRTYVRRFDHDEARARRASGESIASIAESYGVTKGAVYLAVSDEASRKQREYHAVWHQRMKHECSGDECSRMVSRGHERCPSCASKAAQPMVPQHGTEVGYSQGCRCDQCRKAATEARRARRAANPEADRAYQQDYWHRVKKHRRRANRDKVGEIR